MKKPKIEAEEQQPRKVIRPDKAPTSGYSLVVDGHFKSHHDTVEVAEEAGMALKNKFPMLQVQVYDAATKTRSLGQWPGPAVFCRSAARRFAGLPANPTVPEPFHPISSMIWRGLFWPQAEARR